MSSARANRNRNVEIQRTTKPPALCSTPMCSRYVQRSKSQRTAKRPIMPSGSMLSKIMMLFTLMSLCNTPATSQALRCATHDFSGANNTHLRVHPLLTTGGVNQEHDQLKPVVEVGQRTADLLDEDAVVDAGIPNEGFGMRIPRRPVFRSRVGLERTMSGSGARWLVIVVLFSFSGNIVGTRVRCGLPARASPTFSPPRQVKM